MKQTNTGFNHRIYEPTQEESGSTTFRKTLGGTVYKVNVHYNRTGKETFEDKILRMLKSEVVDIA